MARFSIKHPKHQHDKFYGIVDSHHDPATRLYKREDLIELRDLLNREFPDFVECEEDFSANGCDWGCELPMGHTGLHAAPGVNEVEAPTNFLPIDTKLVDPVDRVVERLQRAARELPKAVVKERRERIATAVLAAAYASGRYDPRVERGVVVEGALKATDALIEFLDKTPAADGPFDKG